MNICAPDGVWDSLTGGAGVVKGGGFARAGGGETSHIHAGHWRSYNPGMDVSSAAELESTLAPLWRALPRGHAMAALVVDRGATDELRLLVDHILAKPAIARHAQGPALAAGLWLYVDQLDSAHRICQAHEGDATHDYWHAILHRREGDFSNSKYWFRRVGRHEAMTAAGENYDPVSLVDAVEQAVRENRTTDALLARQRQEWRALFDWCAARV